MELERVANAVERLVAGDGVPDYAQSVYWDERHDAVEWEEWYCDWDAAKAVLLPFLERGQRILCIGNGTSSLPLEMHSEVPGIDIVSCDVSRIAMERMRLLAPFLQWDILSVDDMHHYQTSSFDIIIDKACLDAIASNHALVTAAVTESCRVLRQGGLFVSLSHSAITYYSCHIPSSRHPFRIVTQHHSCTTGCHIAVLRL